MLFQNRAKLVVVLSRKPVCRHTQSRPFRCSAQGYSANSVEQAKYPTCGTGLGARFMPWLNDWQNNSARFCAGTGQPHVCPVCQESGLERFNAASAGNGRAERDPENPGAPLPAPQMQGFGDAGREVNRSFGVVTSAGATCAGVFAQGRRWILVHFSRVCYASPQDQCP